MTTLTPELRRELEKSGGNPVRLEDPETNTAYVLLKAEEYDRLNPGLRSENVPTEQVPEGIRRSREAFLRELPDLLRRKRLLYRWVLYYGDKQIGAIVKTIQTDTQDAVSAMEKSTQGVVEGARLSDAAGQALAEIGTVSQRLAQLIEVITTTTQQQATSASEVATSMQDILNITQQTTEGTKRTAVSIGQLAELAKELKGSVSGFKIG